MSKLKLYRTAALAIGLVGLVGNGFAQSRPSPPTPLTARQSERTNMDLGNFSISLNVKDIRASLAFYEKLDFKPVGGQLEQNWVVLQNGNTKIGLFQGMFDRNILTFNPGWAQEQQTLKDFEDVRELQRRLKARGLRPTSEADEKTEGPAHFTLVDPDGNTLLFDQHVPSPKR